MPSLNYKKLALLFGLTALSILGYMFFGYQLERSEHVSLVVVYSLLFAVSYLLVSQFKGYTRSLTLLAVVFRLILLFALPELSQDFYRFIWDGRVILAGYSPYLYPPTVILEANDMAISQAGELVRNMGSLSAGNLSNYPPVNQFFFVLAALISGNSILGSVIVMRLLTILADIGIVIVGMKFLRELRIPEHHIFWYALNPLIIVELTGNLHFESVMLFFVLLALYLIHTHRWKWAAVALGVSVSIKLIPLIFIPLLFRRLGWKRWLLFSGLSGSIALATFIPFFSSDLLDSYLETTGLWFQKFEFNASIYYLMREAGFLFRGYNEIQIIGIATSLFVFLFVIHRSFRKTNARTTGVVASMLFVISVYFFTATTVHPWYIATPLLLSIFTPYKYVQVWSLFIVLSYLAYITPDAHENSLSLFIEYAVVYAVFIYEIVAREPIEAASLPSDQLHL